MVGPIWILWMCVSWILQNSGVDGLKRRISFEPSYMTDDEIIEYIRSFLFKASSTDPLNEQHYFPEIYAEDLHHQIDKLMPSQTFSKWLQRTKLITDGVPLTNYQGIINAPCAKSAVFNKTLSSFLKEWDEDRTASTNLIEKWLRKNDATPPSLMCNRFRGLTCQNKRALSPETDEGKTWKATPDSTSCQCGGDPENVGFYKQSGTGDCGKKNKGDGECYPEGCYVRPWRPCKHLSAADSVFKDSYSEFHKSLESERMVLGQLVFPVGRTNRCKEGTYCFDLIPGLKKPVCWCDAKNVNDEECLENNEVPLLGSKDLMTLRKAFVNLILPATDKQSECAPEFNENIQTLVEVAGKDPTKTGGVDILMKIVRLANKNTKICDFRDGIVCDRKTKKCLGSFQMPEELDEDVFLYSSRSTLFAAVPDCTIEEHWGHADCLGKCPITPDPTLLCPDCMTNSGNIACMDCTATPPPSGVGCPSPDCTAGTTDPVCCASDPTLCGSTLDCADPVNYYHRLCYRQCPIVGGPDTAKGFTCPTSPSSCADNPVLPVCWDCKSFQSGSPECPDCSGGQTDKVCCLNDPTRSPCPTDCRKLDPTATIPAMCDKMCPIAEESLVTTAAGDEVWCPDCKHNPKLPACVDCAAAGAGAMGCPACTGIETDPVCCLTFTPTPPGCPTDCKVQANNKHPDCLGKCPIGPESVSCPDCATGTNPENIVCADCREHPIGIMGCPDCTANPTDPVCCLFVDPTPHTGCLVLPPDSTSPLDCSLSMNEDTNYCYQKCPIGPPATHNNIMCPDCTGASKPTACVDCTIAIPDPSCSSPPPPPPAIDCRIPANFDDPTCIGKCPIGPDDPVTMCPDCMTNPGNIVCVDCSNSPAPAGCPPDCTATPTDSLCCVSSKPDSSCPKLSLDCADTANYYHRFCYHICPIAPPATHGDIMCPDCMATPTLPVCVDCTIATPDPSCSSPPPPPPAIDCRIPANFDDPACIGKCPIGPEDPATMCPDCMTNPGNIVCVDCTLHPTGGMGCPADCATATTPDPPCCVSSSPAIACAALSLDCSDKANYYHRYCHHECPITGTMTGNGYTCPTTPSCADNPVQAVCVDCAPHPSGNADCPDCTIPPAPSTPPDPVCCLNDPTISGCPKDCRDPANAGIPECDRKCPIDEESYWCPDCETNPSNPVCVDCAPFPAGNPPDCPDCSGGQTDPVCCLNDPLRPACPAQPPPGIDCRMDVNYENPACIGKCPIGPEDPVAMCPDCMTTPELIVCVNCMGQAPGVMGCPDCTANPADPACCVADPKGTGCPPLPLDCTSFNNQFHQHCFHKCPISPGGPLGDIICPDCVNNPGNKVCVDCTIASPDPTCPDCNADPTNSVCCQLGISTPSQCNAPPPPPPPPPQSDLKLGEQCRLDFDLCDKKLFLECTPEGDKNNQLGICTCVKPLFSEKKNIACAIPYDGPCSGDTPTLPAGYQSFEAPICYENSKCVMVNGNPFCRPDETKDYPMFVSPERAGKLDQILKDARSRDAPGRTGMEAGDSDGASAANRMYFKISMIRYLLAGFTFTGTLLWT